MFRNPFRNLEVTRWLSRLPLGRGIAGLGLTVLLATALAGCKNGGGGGY